ncbi:DNA polymerase III subunit delta [Helicobacter sp. MIT 21-1697]|uniref:DNA polymerase III subunit delta n=1 Tax=Helicobacter sp. MIT 21-1697 TaxID=2993733 RepID=UPI00224A5C28|nr:DNA polymerase III subunit delta [Helicobacter sp. MIT 21-1697]MCX2716318.1 DNA polymerase III subunit delta [Helicobacter sp. MIT 21-1697]
MYKSQLDTLLKQSAPRVSFLYGDSFLIGYYAKKIESALKSEEKTTFYFDEYNAININTLLSQGSLFGSSSLVVLKINHKLLKADIEMFLYALLHNAHNALIIEYYQAANKSDGDYTRDCKTCAGYFKNPKMPKDSIAEVRFFPPNISECMGFMRERSKELGLMTDDKILKHILEKQNNDIALSLNELEKFVIFAGKPIEPSDVNLLCDGIASFSVEELCFALMDKKPIVKMLHTIYEEGINEIMMIGEIQRFFYQLFLFFAFIKIKGRPDAKEILGFSPPAHIAERLSRYCIRFKETEYIAIFELLSQWRYEVSKGKTKQSMSALIKIQEMIR